MQAFDSLLSVHAETLTFGQMTLRAVVVFAVECNGRVSVIKRGGAP